jgi:hypothetical protein
MISDSKREYNKQYKLKIRSNPDYRKMEYEKHKLYVLDNKEKISEYTKEWRNENKEHVKEYKRNQMRERRSHPEQREKDAAYSKRRYSEKSEVLREERRKYYRAHREKSIDGVKNYNDNLRLEVIYFYSNGEMTCDCCGNTHLEFLEIDHINNDGSEHRKKIGVGGSVLVRWIIKNNYPDGFQVICRNCNIEKSKFENLKLLTTPIKVRNANYYQSIRRKVIGYYSNTTFECECCGENKFDVLCIDHIDGGGCDHLKKINMSLTVWLNKMNFPDKEKYRVLCENCNASYGRYGYCPHNSHPLL